MHTVEIRRFPLTSVSAWVMRKEQIGNNWTARFKRTVLLTVKHEIAVIIVTKDEQANNKTYL